MHILKGSLINLNTIHHIYDSLSSQMSGPKRIGMTLFIAVSTCVFSLGCAFILWWLDNQRRRELREVDLNNTGSSSFPLNLSDNLVLFFLQPTNFTFGVSVYLFLIDLTRDVQNKLFFVSCTYEPISYST